MILDVWLQIAAWFVCATRRLEHVASSEAMGGVQASDAWDALELNRADLGEGRTDTGRRIDDLLGHEHIAWPRVIRDPRRQVHRSVWRRDGVEGSTDDHERGLRVP